jgi:sodium transport system permease protein
MRLPIVLTICRKELRETLRDKRTLILALGLPVLLYPSMSLFMATLFESRLVAQKARTSHVAVWGQSPDALLDWLRQNTNLTLEPWLGIPTGLRQELEAGTASAPPPPTNRPSAPPAKPADPPSPGIDPFLPAARAVITERKADAVLVAWPGLAQSLDQGALGRISIYADTVRGDSTEANRRLSQSLAQFRLSVLEAREARWRLEPGFTTGLEIQAWNVAPKRRQIGELLGSILPVLLILMTASSGIYAAIDLTAGEKERNTMQTLLCAPIHYTEIIYGKFVAVWTITVIAALANFSSIAATLTRMIQPRFGLQVGWDTFALAFLLIVPVAFIVAAIYLAVAVFARDFKDGQNFLTPLLLLLTFPAGITVVPGLELTAWTAFVPLVNIALLIKTLFLGEVHLEQVFLTGSSSLAYAMLALLFATRVFAREQILLGGKDSLRSLFSHQGPRTLEPTPALALTVYGILFAAIFYGSLALQNTGLITTILVSEIGFFLLPVLLVTYAFGYEPRNSFALQRPSWQGLLAALLIGGSAWAFVGGVLIRVLPPPESFVEAMEKVFLLKEPAASPGTIWLVLALTPALCEEVFFRGFVLTGLRRFGAWRAIAITALLFGLAHSSIYRLLPTFFLGILFGCLVWRTRSLLCAILAHTLNNGIALTLLNTAEETGERTTETMFLPWDLTLLGTAVMVAGLWLLARAPQPDQPGSPLAPSMIKPS